jgi:hypothetical protein
MAEGANPWRSGPIPRQANKTQMPRLIGGAISSDYSEMRETAPKKGVHWVGGYLNPTREDVALLKQLKAAGDGGRTMRA